MRSSSLFHTRRRLTLLIKHDSSSKDAVVKPLQLDDSTEHDTGTTLSRQDSISSVQSTGGITHIV